MTRLTYTATEEHNLERSRTLATLDAIQHVRRAKAALEAARCGEGDATRLKATFGAHRCLVIALRELELLG